ncbi:hypothetical protein [Snodgrassella alvi]|nr:hypothetical protein [Snodgrassella alvi]
MKIHSNKNTHILTRTINNPKFLSTHAFFRFSARHNPAYSLRS